MIIKFLTILISIFSITTIYALEKDVDTIRFLDKTISINDI